MMKIYVLLKKFMLNSLYKKIYKKDGMALCLDFAF